MMTVNTNPARAISAFNYAAHNATAGREYYAAKVRMLYAATRPVAQVAAKPRKSRKA